MCESDSVTKGATMRTILAIAVLIAGIGVLTLSAGPLAVGSTAPQLPAGSVPNVIADLALGQDDLLHDQENLVDSASFDDVQGVATDGLGHVYVSDAGNNRILGWRNMSALVNGQGADLVIGQPDFLSYYCNQAQGAASFVSSSNTLCYPEGLAVDNADNLYAVDSQNSRVLEYNTPFNTCATFPCVGPAANLVFGQGSSGTNFGSGGGGWGPAGLNVPSGVAVDGSGNVYIADPNNQRVLEYNDPLGSSPPNVTADLVFGQGSSGTSFSATTCTDGQYGDPPPSATGLCFPTGVTLDRSGNLYVDDNRNNRVLEYNDPLGSSPPNVTADLVVGQGSSGNNFTTGACTGVPPTGFDDTLSQPTATGLCQPEALTVDGTGDLWVADSTNNRLLEYITPLTTDVTADLVLGQFDFNHRQYNRTKAQGLFFGFSGEVPEIGVAVDSLDHVYVADQFNNRVLGWRNAGALATGQPADLVIGQRDFKSYMVNEGGLNSPTAETLSWPAGVNVDGAGNLYVVDYNNGRVLEYTAPFSACSSFPCVGGPANIVFGIDATGKNFTTVGTCSSPTATDLCYPAGVAIDGAGNVYISDNGFGRVLEYNNPLGSNPPNVTADLVFGIDSTGQNFTSRGGSTITATSLDSPVGLAFDASGNLYVADNNFNRVLEYNNPLGSSPPNVTADLVLGVDSTGKNFNSLGICERNAISVCPPTGLAFDANGNLYVANGQYNRVLEFNNPVGSNPPNVTADLVFGQQGNPFDFTDDGCDTEGLDTPSVSATVLCYPEGVALDTQGNLYVVDTQNNRVVVYNQPLGDSKSAPTPTPTASATATATATPTITATPTATPLPTPVPVKLEINPRSIDFGVVRVGHGRAHNVKVTNPKGNEKNPGITVYMEGLDEPGSPFTVNNLCTGPLLAGRFCQITVSFAPANAVTYRATLKFVDNAKSEPQSVSLTGKGKSP
jgi:sugar lactone lactonase YvrE